MVSIAIIGSGPAGCYVAEHLLKLLPDARIDMLEKLPVPFGLIRYGVAPDHQGTKGAARVMERTLAREQVRFFGNVEVGRDITLDELRQMYHVVVLATGATRDRKLDIPGEELPGVIGSGAFVSWYNGHPSRTKPHLRDVRSAVIIGNGNVALDVARILAKHGDELKRSDLTPDVLETLRSQKIEDIHIVGRRSAAEAKFNEHELEELGGLQQAKPLIENSEELRGETPVQKVLQKFAGDERTGLPVTIHFHFGLTPVTFAGADRSVKEGQERHGLSAGLSGLVNTTAKDVSGAEAPADLLPPGRWPEGQLYPSSHLPDGHLYQRWPEGQLYPNLQSVCFRTSSGEEVEIPAQLAVTCIGYEAVPCCTATPANGVFANDAGKIAEGLYVVGWAKRGPSGTIPTNRAEALQVAQKIAAEIGTRPEREAADLADLLRSRGVTWVDFAGWKRIEAAERAGAGDERCRLKLLQVEEMIQVAQQSELQRKND